MTIADLRAAATDPVELLDRVLAAIRAAQPLYHAFVTIDEEGARRAAAELARATDRGPLHGIPVAVKDLVDTAGVPTTMGSRHFAGRVPDRDAEVVAPLRAAGAVMVGKTTTHEFAYGPTGDVSATGPCANPRDPGRMAGGSSAGSAAAVAAGLVPLAVGTDTGGSVRIPAALCGVVGLRPSFGRVPTTGVFPLSWSLDTVGPIAGSVADAELGWQVLSGSGRSLPPPEPGDLRIGLVTDERLDPTIRSTVDELVAALARAGATVRPVPAPDLEELRDVYRVVQSAEAYSIHRERVLAAPGLFEPETLDRLRTAGQVPAWEYAPGLRRLAQLREAAQTRFDDVDVLLLPTVPVPAPPLGARDADLGGGWRSPREALLAFNSPWSVLGLPAISVPLVPTAGHLPVGAQLVGPPGTDAELLAIAKAVEAISQR